MNKTKPGTARISESVREQDPERVEKWTSYNSVIANTEYDPKLKEKKKKNYYAPRPAKESKAVRGAFLFLGQFRFICTY